MGEKSPLEGGSMIEVEKKSEADILRDAAKVFDLPRRDEHPGPSAMSKLAARALRFQADFLDAMGKMRDLSLRDQVNEIIRKVEEDEST